MVKRKYKDIESDKNIPENEEYRMKRKRIRITKDSDKTIALLKRSKELRNIEKKIKSTTKNTFTK